MRSQKIQSILIFIALLSILLVGCIENQQENDAANGQDVTVTRVIDGDTLVVMFSNQSTATIRLLGVDCPETSIEYNSAYEYQDITNLSCLTYYGNQAKMYVTSLLNNSLVRISFDTQAQKKDQYDRFLCYVTYESLDFNARLIEEGYARVYTLETFSKKENYLSLEEKAIEQKIGLWDCSQSDHPLIIETVHYDAEGNDAENLNDEYVVLLNTGDKTIDLSGWSMHDEHGNMFYFPNGFFLTAQGSVTIYTGRGTNMTTALYWYHETPVWNNAGDTVFILDEKNDSIVTYSW